MPQKDRAKYNVYMAEYMLRRYHERRQWAFDKMGDRCCQCGSRTDLEFDHVDPATKSFSTFKLWSVARARFEAEIQKCQVLCRPCHIEKSRSNGEYHK